MGDSDWLDAQEMQAWAGFLAASTIITRRVEQQLKDAAGLSHPQFEVLSRLLSSPDGELRMSDLAGAALTSKSGLSYQVGQLEKAGFVSRRSFESDDRGVVAVLTAAGRAKLLEAVPGLTAIVRDLFLGGLSKKQFAGLVEGIDAINERLAES